MIVRFMHIRAWDDFKDEQASKGGVTVAYTPITNGPNGISGRYLTFAVCSEKEAYCRAIGREAALENGRSGFEIFVSREDFPNCYDWYDTIEVALVKYFEACVWTKKGRKKLARVLGEWKNRLNRKD